MRKQKTVNYTDAQESRLREIYQGAEDNDDARAAAVTALALEMNKTEASIRSKLGNMNIYIAKAKAVPKGKGLTKEKIIEQISDAGGRKQDTFFDSLASANKSVLEYIQDLQAENAELQVLACVDVPELDDLPEKSEVSDKVGESS